MVTSEPASDSSRCLGGPQRPWVEKYRPRSLEDISSQQEVVQVLRNSLSNRSLPHLMFYGPPGTGKTSTVLALARDLYGSHYKEKILELNASDERGIAVVREKVKGFAKTVVAGDFKLIILDEADSMTHDAQAALRRIIETYTTSTRFCILCNYPHKIIEPLASRCLRFRFKPVDHKSAVARLTKICNIEELNYESAALELLISSCGGDLRQAINQLQNISKFSGEVNISAVIEATGSIPEDAVEEFVYKSEKSLDELRLVVNHSLVRNGVSFVRFIEELLVFVLKNSIYSSTKKAFLVFHTAAVYRALLEGADGELHLLFLGSKFQEAEIMAGSKVVLD